jgi:predicted enzyme related to lactoylglutathione lyase
METGTQIKITESNVTIMISDMDRSVDFYLSIGFTIKQRWENHYAMLSAPGITIGLHPGGDSHTGSGNISIGLMAEDINEIKSLLNGNKIKYKDEDGDSGHYFHFKDPDGTVIYFVKPKWEKEY